MRALVLEADWNPRQGYAVTEAELSSHKAVMASQVWQHPRFSVAEIADPTPGPGEVVVRVGACGVCGSDTHCLETDDHDYVLFSGPARLPVVPGHEYTGEVVAVGPGVRSVRVGQLVAAEGMLYCGVCAVCKRGRFNQCPNLEMVGFSSPGAYAEYISVHERHLWSLDTLAEHTGSESKALELGALVEPISCSYNGIWVSGGGMPPGSHVAVYGCGPIGLGAILLCRAAGAASITAFDRSPERVALARTLGADTAWTLGELSSAGTEPASVVLEQTAGWGADWHIECAGAAVATMPQIERSLAPNGTMVYLGRTGERAPVQLDVLVTQAGRIVGARGHAGQGCFPQIIRLLERGRLDAGAMITARMPFADTTAALERSTLRTDGKIMVRF